MMITTQDRVWPRSNLYQLGEFLPSHVSQHLLSLRYFDHDDDGADEDDFTVTWLTDVPIWLLICVSTNWFSFRFARTQWQQTSCYQVGKWPRSQLKISIFIFITVFLLIIIIIIIVIFCSVLGDLAVSLGYNPLYLMLPAAVIMLKIMEITLKRVMMITMVMVNDYDDHWPRR